jgi:proprotein convertase subtilisin/kexin type 5
MSISKKKKIGLLGDSINLCTVCPTTSFRKNNVAIDGTCPCLDKYFDDGLNELCLPCHYSCKTCSSALKEHCTSCELSKNRIPILSNFPSECVCQNNFYDDQS